MSDKTRSPRKQKKVSIRELSRRAAKAFSVSESTAHNWHLAGWPIANHRKLAECIVVAPRVAPEAARIARQMLNKEAHGVVVDIPEFKPSEPASATETTHQTQSTEAASGGIDDLEQTIKILQERLALYNRQIDGHESLTVAEVKMWAGLVNDTAKAVVANRLAQKKLGMEVGETLSKGECIRIAHAIASRLAVGVQSVIKRVSPQVAGMETAAQVAKAIESACIEELMVAPMLASVNIQSGVSLPPWFVEAIKTGIGNFVED
jgi:hypothetical protein